MEESEYLKIKYLHENFSVVRCNNKKVAIQKHTKTAYQKSSLLMVANNHSDGGHTAILTGARSNNLEILDFDLKNAVNPHEFYENFILLIGIKLGNDFLKKIVIQSTPSGGYHWLYRTDKVDGNKKLCKGKNKEAIIETRGEGGYFVINPSEGYTMIQGEMSEIPVIKNKQKEDLWDAARSVSEFKEVERVINKTQIKTHTALSNEYRGVDNQPNYWEKFDQTCDYLRMLEQDGWTSKRNKGNKYLMRRPNKNDDSWSADLDLDHEYGALLYVYTTSTALDSEKAYPPSSYLINFRFNGDAIKAYDWLIENDYAPPRKDKSDEVAVMAKAPETREDAKSMFDKYAEFKVDSNTVVENPVPIITINGVGALHTGELLAFSGESKSGKSSVISAIISKVLNPNAQGFDIIKTKNTDFPILHFDSEQPIHRHKANLKYSIMKRANIQKYPEQLMSYNLRRVGVDQRKLMVSELIESAKIEFGGVFLVIIDGISDFMYDTNDNKESASIVDWMLQISTTHNCGLICVIHLNPSVDGGFTKQRGHIGSELQRKVDSLLVLKKSMADGVEESVLSAHYLRNGGVNDFGEHSIFYDKETNMHQLVVNDSWESNAFTANEKAVSLAKSIIGMDTGSAVKHLSQQGGFTSLKSAHIYIKELLQYDYITENDGTYQGVHGKYE